MYIYLASVLVHSRFTCVRTEQQLEIKSRRINAAFWRTTRMALESIQFIL